MSRRARRPANLVANCHQDQDRQDSQLNVHQQHQDAGLKALSECFCSSDQLQAEQSEDTEEHESPQQYEDIDKHEASQQSEDAEERKASQQSEDSREQTPEQCLDHEEEKTQQRQQHCQDNSRRLSLQELIDEANNGEKGAAAGSQEESASGDIHEVAEAPAASVTKQPERVAGRKMIGMMRRYVRVRSIKAKRAPEKNVASVC